MFLRDKFGWGDLIMLAVSLIFSSLAWGLMKLSDTYTSLYLFRVEASTNLPGREFSSVSTEPVAVIGSSSGYYLLNHTLDTKRNKNIVALNVQPSMLKKVKGSENKYYALVDQLAPLLKEKIEGKIHLSEFSTDTLYFEFKKVATKRVKVFLKSKFSFKKEFMPLEKMILNPDSIDIQGLESVINAIDSLPTESIARAGIEENIQGVAKVKPVKGVVFSQNEIYYSQKVGRYFESGVEVPIAIRNLPAEKSLRIFPKSVIVTYRAQYNNKKEISSDDFKVWVDYRQITNPLEKGARIYISDLPDGVVEAHANKLYLDNYIISDVK